MDTNEKKLLHYIRLLLQLEQKPPDVMNGHDRRVDGRRLHAQLSDIGLLNELEMTSVGSWRNTVSDEYVLGMINRYFKHLAAERLSEATDDYRKQEIRELLQQV